MPTDDPYNGDERRADIRNLYAQLHELRARLEGHERLMDERKEAVNNALLAVEKQTSASFMASDKAITKAEEAQRAYNLAHNDLLRKQDLLIPRLEAENRFKALEIRIGELRDLSNTGEGRRGGMMLSGAFADRVLTLILAAATLLFAVLWAKHS